MWLHGIRVVAAGCLHVHGAVVDELDGLAGAEAHEGGGHLAPEPLLHLEDDPPQLRVAGHQLQRRVEVLKGLTIQSERSGSFCSCTQRLKHYTLKVLATVQQTVLFSGNNLILTHFSHALL